MEPFVLPWCRTHDVVFWPYIAGLMLDQRDKLPADATGCCAYIAGVVQAGGDLTNPYYGGACVEDDRQRAVFIGGKVVV